jgi:hypothetical protein
MRISHEPSAAELSITLEKAALRVNVMARMGSGVAPVLLQSRPSDQGTIRLPQRHWHHAKATLPLVCT